MEILVVLVIGGAAVAAVLIPLLRGAGPADPQLGDGAGAAPAHSDPQQIERLVKQYRAALRAGTVCRRCGRANPSGSAFCAECGRRLRSARAIPDAGGNAA
jgi:hypothetical protein